MNSKGLLVPKDLYDEIAVRVAKSDMTAKEAAIKCMRLGLLLVKLQDTEIVISSDMIKEVIAHRKEQDAKE